MTGLIVQMYYTLFISLSPFLRLLCNACYIINFNCSQSHFWCKLKGSLAPVVIFSKNSSGHVVPTFRKMTVFGRKKFLKKVESTFSCSSPSNLTTCVNLVVQKNSLTPFLNEKRFDQVCQLI